MVAAADARKLVARDPALPRVVTIGMAVSGSYARTRRAWCSRADST